MCARVYVHARHARRHAHHDGAIIGACFCFLRAGASCSHIASDDFHCHHESSCAFIALYRSLSLSRALPCLWLARLRAFARNWLSRVLGHELHAHGINDLFEYAPPPAYSSVLAVSCILHAGARARARTHTHTHTHTHTVTHWRTHAYIHAHTARPTGFYGS